MGKDDKLFLVNLEQDKTEMANLAGEHPDEVQRLKRLNDQWQPGLQGK